MNTPRAAQTLRRASMFLLGITLGLLFILLLETIAPDILWLPGQPRTVLPEVQWGFRTFPQDNQ